MAATYTITGTKDIGGAKMIYGTWATAGGTTTGTITWGGTRTGDQGCPFQILDATCVSSVSAVTMTASKVQADGTLVYTCVANDTGYWSVTTL